MGSASADDSGGVAVGTLLAGRYRIAGMLGTGGMGRVYRADHTGLGKPVAVKVLHATLGRDQEAAQRFQREAIASGRLEHPNVISVIDFGVTENGRLYLVMEALDGEHLGQRLQREKRLPWAEALLIIRSVLLGLRHAHDRGVVHRDVKPDNIFLASKDGESVVKILDFGIAKLYAGTAEAQCATRTGITVGTPTYLAPEQAVGGAITPASDIYSTSVVLYELLTGRAPFEDPDPIALMTAHVGSEPPTIRSVARDLEIPHGIEPLVRHGLAKIGAERVGSAEYVQRIEEILRTNGVDVAPSGFARSSQSIGIPIGPYASTPVPDVLTPSSGVLATPMTLAAATALTTPTSRVAPIAHDAGTKRALAAANSARRSYRRTLVAALALATAIAGSMLYFAHAGGTRAPAASAQVAPPPAEPASKPADDRAASLKSALQDLQDGATCGERKKAVSKLVELGDPAAIPALKKARSRAKANACMRSAADRAIKTLDGGRI